MMCPNCRRFTPPGVARCPACGTVYASATQAAGRRQTTPPRPPPAQPSPPPRASATSAAGHNGSLRSAAAAALVNYVASRVQPAVQGYLAGAAPPKPPAQAPPAASVPVPASQDLPQVLAEGYTLSKNRYYLGPMLGRGCFGTTYRAIDQSLGRIVAIKEYFPEGSVRQGQTILPPASLGRDGYEQERAHFIREAQILARFQCPGIVAVYEVFEQNDTAYMAMEYIAGRTLADTLRERNGPLPAGQAVRYVLAVADALAAVHAQHLLHRDVKPANIMLTPSDDAVLIDFGAARHFDRGQRTSLMTAIGTPGYAPLEQWGSSGRFGPTADVYALAATLYHLLTGQMPPSAADRAVQDTLEPPHLLNPTVPEAVSRVVVHALAVRMTERPQTMAEFAAALRAGERPAAQERRHGGGSSGQSPRQPNSQRPVEAPVPRRDGTQKAGDATVARPPLANTPIRLPENQATQPPTPAPAPLQPASPPPLPTPAASVEKAMTATVRRLPRPLPQSVGELLLYAAGGLVSPLMFATSILALTVATPALGLATITSGGTPQRAARFALKRTATFGVRGLRLSAVCLASLVVVTVATGTGLVLAPLFAFGSARRARLQQRRRHQRQRYRI